MLLVVVHGMLCTGYEPSCCTILKQAQTTKYHKQQSKQSTNNKVSQNKLINKNNKKTTNNTQKTQHCFKIQMTEKKRKNDKQKHQPQSYQTNQQTTIYNVTQRTKHDKLDTCHGVNCPLVDTNNKQQTNKQSNKQTIKQTTINNKQTTIKQQ